MKTTPILLMTGVPLVCGHAHDIACLAGPWAGHKHWTGLTIYLTFLIATDGSNRLISCLYCQCSILPVLNSANLVNLTPRFQWGPISRMYMSLKPNHRQSPLQGLNTDGFHIGSSWHLCYFYLTVAMLLRVFKREVFHSAIFFFKSGIVCAGISNFRF